MRAAVIGLSVCASALVGIAGTAHLKGDFGIYVSVFSGLAAVVTLVVPIPLTEFGRRYHGHLINSLGGTDGACVQSWTRHYREFFNVS